MGGNTALAQAKANIPNQVFDAADLGFSSPQEGFVNLDFLNG